MSTPATTEAALQALNTPERVEPEAPAAPAEPVAPPPLNLDDDAAVDAALETDAIQTPDGGKLVDAKTAGDIGRSYRGKIKELKAQIDQLAAGSEKATQLEAEVAHLKQSVQQLTPYVQAYQGLVQQQPQAPKEPEISDADAERYAKRYDLYKADGSGTLDIERGREIISDIRREATAAAEKVTDARVAPMQAQTVAQQSAYMLARAKNTVLPNGVQVDGATLDSIWQRLDPQVTSTPEGAQWALIAALGTQMGMAKPEQFAQFAQPRQRGPNGQFMPASQQTAPIPEAIPREPAGGQPPNAPSALSESERKGLAAIGISEKDYLAIAEGRRAR